jgi:exodeoxyribonuclease V alpha subunit
LQPPRLIVVTDCRRLATGRRYRRFDWLAYASAYTTTIHKSQRSENPAVVIPVSARHDLMLQRNLLYTGVTRGKQLVILLGQKKAVAITVKNVSGWRRWSNLGEWLNPVSLRLV